MQKKKTGRPSSFTDETADRICERLSSGESLIHITKDPKMPSQAVVYLWLSKFPVFLEKYTRAREFWAEHQFERMMHIAETPMLGKRTKVKNDGSKEVITGDMVDHRRLLVDTIKWSLARMSPKKYSDRQDINLKTPEGITVNVRSVLDPKEPVS